MSWETVRFGDLYAVESRNGLTKPGKVRGSGYKMINMGELFANDRIYDIPMEFVPLKESEKLNARVECGDLLFARQSLVLEGAGKCSIVMEVSPLTVFESHLIRVRLDRSQALPMFYYYYFRSSLSPVKSIVSQCAQAGIRGSDLQELQVILPPIKVQQRIAEIISRYDDLIENNQKQIKLLEEAAQRLYKEWFIDLRFPGHENVKIVDGVPEGWERMVLSEVTSILKRGISPKYSDNGKYSVINQKCIRSSIMDISESRRQEKEYVPTLNLQDSDTVICSTGTGTLGRVGRVYGDYPNTTFDSHVTLVRAKENPNYIYHVVKSQQEYLMGMGRGSTNQQELYRDVIERLVVLCPSQDILLKADRVLNAIHCKIKAVYLQNNLLVESRDRLLPKLMSGEIEV